MDIFNNDLETSNSLDIICGEENNRMFEPIVSLISMINCKFYSPVAFIIEYYNNKGLQQMIEDKTGYNFNEFFHIFLLNFPTVITSRKLKRVILEDEENTRLP